VFEISNVMNHGLLLSLAARHSDAPFHARLHAAMPMMAPRTLALGAPRQRCQAGCLPCLVTTAVALRCVRFDVISVPVVVDHGSTSAVDRALS
jgi:hypothetical protein